MLTFTKFVDGDEQANVEAYYDARYNVLRFFEEIGGQPNPRIYSDALNGTLSGFVTTGLGFNLDDSTVLGHVLRAWGFDTSNNASPNEEAYIQNIDSLVSKKYTWSQINDLQIKLDAIMLNRANDPTVVNVDGTNKRTTFAFGTGGRSVESECREVFDLIAIDKEINVNQWLSGIPESRERLALLSLRYNGVLSESFSLRDAIIAGDRAKAWYEIRFNSNGGASESGGIAKRRYLESQLFGLYEKGTDASNITEDQSKRIYQVITQNRTLILNYEFEYGDEIVNANSDYAGTGIQVQSLDQILEWPGQRLINTYVTSYGLGTQVGVLDIQVGTDGADELDGFPRVAGEDQNDLMLGEGGSDHLNGEGGDDVLFGGDGADELFGAGGKDALFGDGDDDWLVGGPDDDTMDGGEGYDTYVINTGDGNDLINDADGIGVIVYNGQPIALGLKDPNAAGNTYMTPDGTVITVNSPLTIHGTDGGAVVLENYDAGRYGIVLVDTPAAPVGTHVVAGTGSGDALDDTAADDDVEGFGGDDVITVRYGGQDFINAGDGDDLVWGLVYETGDDKIFGGTGRDRIVSSGGNDWIWADQEADLSQVIADGDVGAGTGVGEWLDGAGGNDTVVGDAGTDALWGGGGNDLLIAGAGDDNIGGDWYTDRSVEGNWAINRSVTVDAAGVIHRTLVFQDSGASTAAIYGGDDILLGGAGDDWISGGVGNDYLDGGADSDVVLGDEGSDVVMGGSGDDDISGDAYGITAYGNDYLDGGDGDDTLSGNGDSDRLYGGTGNDLLHGESGSDDGLTGNDFIDAGTGDDVAYGGRGADTLVGGDGADQLSGDQEDDVLSGDAGNDSIAGGDGLDVLTGGADDDELQGGAGDDQLVGGDGADRLSGDDDNDTLNAGAGVDSVWGGDGDDQIAGGGDTDYLLGDGGNDLINGDAGDDFLQGGEDNDALDGGAGKDQLLGETGDDILAGGEGSDLLAGDVGMDQLSGGSGNDGLLGGADSDVIDGGADNDLAFGEAGDDALAGDIGDDQLSGGDGNDLLSGGDGDDMVIGDAGNDILNGDGGRDELQGGDGNDSLDGGSGDDILFGQAGNDTLGGGAGNDILQGDQGADTYVFGRGSGKDVIYNYESGGGWIDVLQFAPDVKSTDVIAYRDGLDQIYAIRGTEDSIRVKNYYASNASQWRLDQIKFADGKVWTATSTPNFVQATLGGGFSYGTNTSDIFAGTEAGDTFVGSDGADTYLWGRRSGRDTVIETSTGGVSTIRVDSSINPADVLVLRSGTDAVLQLRNSPDAMVIRSGASASAGAFNVVFESDGTSWTLSDVLPEALTQSIVESADGAEGDAAASDTQQAVPNGDGPSAAQEAALIQAAGMSVTGTTGNDNLQGAADDDSISGLGGNDTLSGLAGNDTLDGGAGTDSLVGGLGNDVFVVDSTADIVVEASNEGTDSIQSSVTLTTLAANVENLTLTGTGRINATGNTLSNVLTGNTANNALSGGAGDDTLIGGGGTDSLTGGMGNDYYVIDDTRDVITENGSEGTDTVEASYNYTLLANFENLVITGAATTATGNAVANVLTGNALDNTLTGAAGNDTMVGGAGNDTYVVDSSADMILEYAGHGTDTVQSAATYVLSADVENLTLTGTSAINATGNASANVLTGNSAVNVLTGGAGDDTYVVTAGDTIVENADEGADTVQSAATYTLAANIEHLTLTGTSAINGTGNASNNVLTGNSAANVLTGGAGNDTYVVGTGDTVVEAANQGIDTVQSAATYTLGANIEYLTLIGTTAINGAGNALANVLTGNSAANVLTGGAGDDTYVVGSGDTIVESAGEGTDTAQSAVTYTLGANVETLVLTGTAAINGTGNAQANTITGNSANNILDGGTGADTLIGGLGDDTYVIDNAGDVVIEAVSEGSDTVQTSFSYVSGGNVENITLLGTGAINATGDGINNVLTGNSGSNVLTGLGGDDTLSGGGGSDTLIGGVGNDTYVLAAGSTIVENDNEGIDTVQAASTYTLVANLENATLTGTSAANLWGNEVANVLTGNSAGNSLNAAGGGNDTLYGGAGNDTLIGEYGDEMHGGAGDDSYVFTGGANTEVRTDWETESGAGGIDSVTADFSLRMYDYSRWNSDFTAILYIGSIENATLSGTGNYSIFGNDSNNILTGNSGNNSITDFTGLDRLDGGSGNDTILGGSDATMIGGLGDDRLQLVENSVSANLQGGQGNDYYILEYGTGTVTELAAEGIDSVEVRYALGPYTLAANIENLRGNGTMTGNALDNVITGSGTFSGLAGNDTLDGTWSSNVDTLNGGTGDDTFIVGVGDVANESANEGIDTVQASFTYTLGANFENLTLTGTGAINGTGNTAANVLIGNNAANVLAGGAGDDTYVISSGDTVVENAGQGTDTIRADFSYSLAALANVENLELTGIADWTGTGNAVNNVITGSAGANTLDGGAGSDTLRGGAGNDTYIVDNTADVVIENAGEGIDTVQSSVTYILSADVEKLVLTGTAQINGTGNALDNTLTGNAAANTLTGGLGNDTYVITDATDTVIEAANEGVDTVQSSISYTLGSNVENLVLTSSGSINGTGNALANTLTGNSNANVLSGGAGDDTYIVAFGDSTIENANEGIDTVRANTDWTLGANIENLVLLSSGLTGTGNTLNNAITGNNGANTIDGGAGADTLTGGTGDDSYIVDNAGDVVVENVNEGMDTVRSSVTRVLEANVENLVLTGSAAIDGTGNSLANALTGNTSGNQLSGGEGNDTLDGGTGNDTMLGGVGDDVYVVSQVGDVVTEAVGEGTDTIRTALNNFVLGANVENLILTGSGLLGTGNALGNALTSQTSLADTLIGGAGDDTYYVGAEDTVQESAGEGIDTVITSSSYTLGANFENLTLTGSTALSGTGNAFDNVITGNDGVNVLTGGAGNDMYYIGAGDSVVEIADEGTDTVYSSATHTLEAHAENLVLTGTAAIDGYGNSTDNLITGSAGSNKLDGLGGADTLAGGAGDDTYTVYTADVTVVENAGEGTDLVISTIEYTLGANLENLQLGGVSAVLGTGNALNNQIIGSVADNVLIGADGNDTLDGSMGADTLLGGLGDDTYDVESIGDVVTEGAGEGTDTVRSRRDYTLGANLENLTLAGYAAVSGTGNELNNVITGSGIGNVIDGGAGADTMRGGAGDDVYFVDDLYDIVDELAGANEGKDTVESTVSYTLGSELEDLVLLGSAALNGTGNVSANWIIGNSAGNVLDGGAGDDTLYGGLGADTMTGGSGRDTFYVDDAADVVVDEVLSGNSDEVISSIDYTLGAYIENLRLTGTAVVGNGNAYTNVIIGNAADNVLDGAAGGDSLIGGLGNDVYFVDDTNDWVAEYEGEGFDEVQASVSVTLAENVEVLALTGSSSLSATGNGLDNLLRGNAGDNSLQGGGGVDVLIGGGGADTLTSDAGNGALDGGGGSDVLLGGAGAELLAGGSGADTLSLGSGADVIAFNVGDGADVVAASAVGSGEHNDTISLGGVRYADLRLAREGDDLLVKVAGTSDSVRLEDWYAAAGNQTVANLQMIVETTADYQPGSGDGLRDSKVKTYDFAGLVSGFDAEWSANPTIGDWAISDAAFETALLSSSDTTAIGGNFAWRYAHDGNLDGVMFEAVLPQVNDAAFGTEAQDIDAPSSAAPMMLRVVEGGATSVETGGGKSAMPMLLQSPVASAEPAASVNHTLLGTSLTPTGALAPSQPSGGTQDLHAPLNSPAAAAATMPQAAGAGAALAGTGGAPAMSLSQEAHAGNDRPAPSRNGGSPGKLSAPAPAQPLIKPYDFQVPVVSAGRSRGATPLPAQAIAAEELTRSSAPEYLRRADLTAVPARDLWIAVDAWSALEQALAMPEDFGMPLPSESPVLFGSGTGAGLSEQALAFQGSVNRVESVTQPKVAQL